MTDEVRVERQRSALVVTIDRPARRNAVDGRTAAALSAAVDRLESDEGAVAMVLTGAGGVFSAGADLTALDTLDVDGPGGPLGPTRRVPAKPVVAAVEGWAVAGGLELALWCDLRIASPGARFGCLERRFGVPLVDGGTVRLPAVVGLGRALEMILTGRVVEAEEALRIGLVTEIAADPLARALEVVELLAGFPQPTLRSDRTSVYRALGRELADALEVERQEGRAVLGTAAQGAAAFSSGQGRAGAAVPGARQAPTDPGR